MKKFACLLLFLSGCSTVSFDWENDVVAHTDNNYSNGFTIQGSAKPDDVPTFLNKIPVPRLSDSDPTEPTRYVVGVRQDIYTPKDLRIKEIQEDQNPYAGTLTFDTEKILATKTERISTKIRIGTSGHPSFADRTQTFVHDTLTDLGRPQTHPEGWDNQIAAEPLLNIDYERDLEHSRANVGPVSVAVQSEVLTRVGNIHTDLTGKIGVRVGHNLPYYDNENEKVFTIYAFSRSFASAILQDICFDGGVLRDSVHTVEKESFVVGLENGIGVGYNSYLIQFLYNIQSRDYKNQAEDTHSFGMLKFGVIW